jgi:hypothetical protein
MFLAVADLLATRPTAKQVSKYLYEKRDEVKEFRRSLGTTMLDDGQPELTETFLGWAEDLIPTDDGIAHLAEQATALHDQLLLALLKTEAFLDNRAKAFAAAGSRSSKNAAKIRENRYLTFLLNVWHDIGGGGAQRKLKIDFLLACARPFFPKMTGKAVEHWLDRVPKRE